jgi:hypothetical protein
MLDNPVYHGLLHDNTCMSQVEVDILLDNVMVIRSYDILLDLCLFQILLYLVLHLCIHVDLLVVCCTEAHDYTVRGYTKVA